jgi:hypothetical protein
MLLVCCLGSTLAQPIQHHCKIKVRDHVNAYMRAIESQTSASHRAGISQSEAPPSSMNIKPEVRNLFQISADIERPGQNYLHNQKMMEYRVADNLFEKMNAMKKITRGGAVSKKNNEIHIVINNPTASRTIQESEFNVDLAKKRAVACARSMIPYIADEIEFDNYAIEIKEDHVDSIQIIFHRVFKNRIVRNDLASVKIQLNSDYKACTIRLKWPSFNPVKGSRNFEAISLSEAAEMVKKILDENYSVLINPADGSEAKVAESIVEGAALSWYPTDASDEMVITPSYSFNINIDLGASKTISDIIDIPVFRKYIP